MMANSARDPYWQAVGAPRDDRSPDARARRSRTSAPPATCRWPQRIARAAGGKGEVFAHLPVTRANTPPCSDSAADGISCTVCHQIAPDGLGTRDSFNANFVLRPTPARRRAGDLRAVHDRCRPPHDHASVSGFVQEEAPHIKQSELCASCHTLITRPSARRRGDRVAARADELPGVAAQRLHQGAARAASRATCPRRRVRSASRRCSATRATRSRATCSSAATRSCCGC